MLGLGCSMWPLCWAGFSCCSVRALWLWHHMWDLSSLTRDQTHAPCSGRGILNHWTIRRFSPLWSFYVHMAQMYLTRWYIPLFPYSLPLERGLASNDQNRSVSG